ncbi:outer membrane beta-barrel protein [Helicobacter labacensis]|uniref:outer membrane beta-barrel protein n=1 Tax=Helicobacter labacensis TaxID=2316079 RepID=UPI001F272337|nr:outer membrane beta-barrel protein [Helicobacter labacensis]
MQFGVQLEGGYQKYFTPFMGIAYYGYFGYRYLYMDKALSAAIRANNVNRYSLGIGANLLFNVYSKIRKPRAGGRAKIQAYGFFGGLLGIAHIWTAQFSNITQAQVSNNANIDAVFGISVRMDRFKWSLGARVPLISQTRTLMAPTSINGYESLTLLDSYKSSSLFMNFTQIF